jgi:protein TonB
MLGTLVFGLGIAGGVFAALTGMIASAAGVPLTRIEARRIEFRFVRPELPVETTRHEKPEHDDVDLPLPDGGDSLNPCFDCDGTRVTSPVVDTGPLDSGLRERHDDWAQGIDADPQPIVRILPEYPANGRGNGSVLVQFDISPAGTVVNARVIEATPHGMFEQSALRAIARWRYRPAVFEGRAVERRGVRVRLRFELERA